MTYLVRRPHEAATDDGVQGRRPALIAGSALLVLAVVAGWANLVALPGLVTENDAQRTARDLSAAGASFGWVIAALFLAVLLDLVVALALTSFFASVSRTVALAAGWCRAGYAAAFAVAIGFLVQARLLLDDVRPADPATADRVLGAVDRYHSVWGASLGVFGLHLLLVGWLAWRSPAVPRVVGALVAVSGAGYVVDAVASVVAPGSGVQVSSVTFVGEVVLLLWLLWFGRPRRGEARAAEDVRPDGPR